MRRSVLVLFVALFTIGIGSRSPLKAQETGQSALTDDSLRQMLDNMGMEPN